MRGHFAISVSSSGALCGNIAMGRVSMQRPILSCYHAAERSLPRHGTNDDIRKLRSFSSCSSFIDDARWLSIQDVRKEATSSLSSRITSSAGRRHHRRRDDEFGTHLRSKGRSQKSDMLQSTTCRRSGSDENVVITFDMAELRHRAATAVVVAQIAAERSVDKIVRFAEAAVTETEEAWIRLRTGTKVPKEKRVVVSIKRSSLEVASKVVLGSIVLVVFSKVFLSALREYRWGWEKGFRPPERVVRDRSLGGKEVTLNKKGLWEDGPIKKTVNSSLGSRGPLSSPVGDSRAEEKLRSSRARGKGASATKRAPHLPRWWPDPNWSPTICVSGHQRAKEEAHRLVQGIMQKRSSGLDFSGGDVLQLRQICKATNVKVKFDTYNTRDSFYRAATNLVLSTCQSSGKFSLVAFGTEDGVGFITGLAFNIGLDSHRAATMVNAAVAARTRAGLLQAKAEMEMVARALGSHFDQEERVRMLKLYESLGGMGTKRIAEEALGLLPTS